MSPGRLLRTLRPAAAGWLACALSAAAVSVAPACQESDERPPKVGSCEGPGCVRPPISGAGGSAGSGGSFSDAAADARTTVQGTVAVFNGEDFRFTTPLGDPAEVRAEAAGGGEVTARYDGTSYELENVAAGPSVWFTVIPELDPVQAMPTIQPVATLPPADAQQLEVVPGETLDLIFDVLTTPTARADGTGQVVLRMVRASNPLQPIVGVIADLPTAEVIAYDTGGGFSDEEQGSGPEGLIVLGNVPALPLPGSEVVVSLRGPVAVAVKVRIAADAVTVGEVPLDL